MTSRVRPGNVPVPEAHLAGIVAAVVLHALRPWMLPGPRRMHLLAGGASIAAGVWLVVRSVAAAGQVDVSTPSRLVTTGPYADSRNPMYVGWTLLHLGLGVGHGSAWTLATLPASCLRIHREILDEEHALSDAFGEEFEHYRATVPRYLP